MSAAAGQVRELDGPPSLARLYTQAVLAPIVPGGEAELPDRRFVLRGAKIDPERVASYSRACGFGVRSVVPATYPHVLAFLVHLCLMTDRSFPFSVLGLVHIANRIETLTPIGLGAALDIAVWAEDLRPHRRGRQFDIVAEGTLDGQVAWRGRSTYLHREGDGSKSSGTQSDRDEPDDESLEISAEWSIPGDVGRRYAAVSGDRNPIHMHPLSARLFGFPTAIAHGMWTKARALAAFEGRLPEAFTINAEFKSPVRIPGTALLLSGRRDDGWAFRVEAPKGEHLHLVGSIS
jgi:hypothetical protein